MVSTQSDVPAFTPESSRATLVGACTAIGVDFRDARLLRLGENAIYHIPQLDLVVRIARGLDVLDDAKKEVSVSRWLNSSGLRAAETADFEQPIVVGDHPVTFWKFIGSPGKEASITDLAVVLRELHALAPPESLDLPSLDFFGRVDARIDRASDVPEADRIFLRHRVRELRAAYAELTFPLQSCAVHGDAHTANLIKTYDGAVALIDFERFAFGHPETDLAVTAVEHRIGWYTDAEYDAFVRAYGFDVTDWSGFPTIQAISELKMTTWIMQNTSHSPEVASEVRTRLDALRDSGAPRRWKPF
jgi:Phosphotransferase enzyme family